MKCLVIGNSITTHGKCSYWWSNAGIAASDELHDYFHIVKNYIDNCKKNTKSFVYAYNYYAWEVQALDRDETFSLLDKYLDYDLDLVIIQLGENVIDVTTYESDFISLVNYIKNRCPRCRVFIIGDFWYSDDRREIKREIAKKSKSIYISLTDIQNREDFMCGMNTEVYGDDGEIHKITHAGVAKHPNDRAMEYIAEKIISRIKICGL